jgi:hypothetical protein
MDYVTTGATEERVAQSYFREFWIITNKGEKLYPALIRNRASGKASYRILADGSNKISDGEEVNNPVEAIGKFLAFRSLRFGREGAPDNRLGASPAFKASNPSVRW